MPQMSLGVSGSLFTMMRRWIIRSAGRCRVSRNVGIVSDCQGRKRAEVLSLECLPGLEIGGKPGVVLLLLCVNRNQLRCFSLVPSLWRVFFFFSSTSNWKDIQTWEDPRRIWKALLGKQTIVVLWKIVFKNIFTDCKCFISFPLSC